MSKLTTGLVLMISMALLPVRLLADNTTSGAADTTGGRPSLGSPDQVDNQLETDAKPNKPLVRFSFLDNYFAWKDSLNERSGLSFGVDYTTQPFWASAGLAEDRAASGMVRLFGSWAITGKESGNTGAFVFKLEHRHAYTTVAPKLLSFNIGYAGIMAGPFNDEGFRWTNLYWRQDFAKGRAQMFAGFLDATDYVDIYALASPWLHFTNLVFSTGSAAMALPNDALLGVAASYWWSNQVYSVASIGDNASDPTDPWDGFDRVFNVNEYYSSLEVGWTTARDRAYFDNVHLTAWHSDRKSEAGDPSGWGLNFSATQFVGDKLMPFLRGGYTEDAGSLLQKSLSAGVGYQLNPERDLLGLGVNWGQPNETTFGPGLDYQYTVEAFWRWQLGSQLAVTPDLQLLINPALNPDENSIWVFGIRARLAL